LHFKQASQLTLPWLTDIQTLSGNRPKLRDVTAWGALSGH